MEFFLLSGKGIAAGKKQARNSGSPQAAEPETKLENFFGCRLYSCFAPISVSRHGESQKPPHCTIFTMKFPLSRRRKYRMNHQMGVKRRFSV
jgi:hypothetical protein